MALLNGIVCDGPRCKRGVNEARLTLIWDGESPDSAPDDVYRFILRKRFYEEPKSGRKEPKEYHFCSKDCERDFIRDEVPPMSPREQYQMEENNRRVEAAKKEKEATPETMEVAATGDTANDGCGLS